jgi:hypothetical protein
MAPLLPVKHRDMTGIRMIVTPLPRPMTATCHPAILSLVHFHQLFHVFVFWPFPPSLRANLS